MMIDRVSIEEAEEAATRSDLKAGKEIKRLEVWCFGGGCVTTRLHFYRSFSPDMTGQKPCGTSIWQTRLDCVALNW